MQKVYGYIRVSTEKQGDGVSLIEQKSDIEAFAKNKNLHIARWFEERVTAAKEGRPLFNEMMALLEEGKAQGAVFHKIDRSSRNYADWHRIGLLADKGVDFYSVSDGINLSDDAQRLPADVLAAMSTHYIRNLRKEVLKGFYGRLKQGILPLPAPIGYLNVGKGKPKQPDPIQAPLVRQCFELYLSGDYGFRQLAKEMYQRGLRNRNGGRVTKNGIATILHNPFYTGIIHIKNRNETFRGAHEPIISRATFNAVQEVLSGKRNRKVLKHDFAFRRVLSCYHCTYSMIGEKQKGHIYYRCHTKDCPTKGVREEVIEKALKAYVRKLSLPTELQEQIMQAVLSGRRRHEDLRSKQVQATKMRLSSISVRLDKLTDALLDSLIDKETFERKKSVLIEEEVTLHASIAKLDVADNDFAEELQKFLELPSTLALQAFSKESRIKREVVRKTTSNLYVDRKSVVIEPNLLFRELLKFKKVDFGEPQLVSPRKLTPNLATADKNNRYARAQETIFLRYQDIQPGLEVSSKPSEFHPPQKAKLQHLTSRLVSLLAKQ